MELTKVYPGMSLPLTRGKNRHLLLDMCSDWGSGDHRPPMKGTQDNLPANDTPGEKKGNERVPVSKTVGFEHVHMSTEAFQEQQCKHVDAAGRGVFGITKDTKETKDTEETKETKETKDSKEMTHGSPHHASHGDPPAQASAEHDHPWSSHRADDGVGGVGQNSGDSESCQEESGEGGRRGQVGLVKNDGAEQTGPSMHRAPLQWSSSTGGSWERIHRQEAMDPENGSDVLYAVFVWSMFRPSGRRESIGQQVHCPRM